MAKIIESKNTAGLTSFFLHPYFPELSVTIRFGHSDQSRLMAKQLLKKPLLAEIKQPQTQKQDFPHCSTIAKNIDRTKKSLSTKRVD